MGDQALVSKEQIDVTGAFTLTDLRNLIFLKLNQRTVRILVLLMIVSYFYNLPVIKYSFTGSNEFRLFDVAGGFIMLYYFKSYGIVHRYIRTDKVFYSLFVFLQYSTFSIIFTCISAILIAKYSWVFQTILYLFHFWAFFITAVFTAVLIRDKKFLAQVVKLLMFSALICFTIIILQNIGIIPYLWNDIYFRAYKGFLSGTLGPNKIVSGMTSLIMLAFAIGLVNEKRFNVSKLLCFGVIAASAINIVLSGSRTAYVGLVIFLVYFFIRSTKSFVYNALIVGVGMIGLMIVQPAIFERVTGMFEYRVTNKIKQEDAIADGDVGALYEDLGAGRGKLLVWYSEMLMDEYYYLPLGRGMNNRLDTFSSAHNMYLSVIYELGIIGLILYFRWLVLYLFVPLNGFSKLAVALQGLVITMLVTLYFGEHLYIYRPLFALLGLFILVATILAAPHYLIEKNEPKITR